MADEPMDAEQLKKMLEQLSRKFDERAAAQGLFTATPEELGKSTVAKQQHNEPPMSFPGVLFERPKPEELERNQQQQVHERNALLTSVALQSMQMLVMTGIMKDATNTDAHVARRSFELAEAFLKERSKRLQVLP